MACIYTLKTWAHGRSSNYPQVECNDLENAFGKSNMAYYAYREYVEFYEAQSPQTMINGVLKCHCESIQSQPSEYTVYDKNGINPRQICKQYAVDIWES